MSCSQILIALAYTHYICSFHTTIGLERKWSVYEALLSQKIAQAMAPLLI